MCDKIKAILAAALFGLGLLTTTQAQQSDIRPVRDRVVISSEQLTNLQQFLDEQAARGNRLAGLSYRTSIMNLRSKGRLEVTVEAAGAPNRYQYRAVITELEAQALERALTEAGAQGFRLLRQAPIPLELGLVRPRDMFVAVMEKTAGDRARYAYRVASYRHAPYVRQYVRQAAADGFVKACDAQFGPVTYLVMEKVTD